MDGYYGSGSNLNWDPTGQPNNQQQQEYDLNYVRSRFSQVFGYPQPQQVDLQHFQSSIQILQGREPIGVGSGRVKKDFDVRNLRLITICFTLLLD